MEATEEDRFVKRFSNGILKPHANVDKDKRLQVIVLGHSFVRRMFKLMAVDPTRNPRKMWLDPNWGLDARHEITVLNTVNREKVQLISDVQDKAKGVLDLFFSVRQTLSIVYIWIGTNDIIARPELSDKDMAAEILRAMLVFYARGARKVIWVDIAPRTAISELSPFWDFYKPKCMQQAAQIFELRRRSINVEMEDKLRDAPDLHKFSMKGFKDEAAYEMSDGVHYNWAEYIKVATRFKRETIKHCCKIFWDDLSPHHYLKNRIEINTRELREKERARKARQARERATDPFFRHVAEIESNYR